MGATLNRRDGSGRVVCGFEADSRGILVYAFLCRFLGFLGVFGVTVVRCTTANHACTTENHGNDQSKEKADGTVSYTVQIRLKKKGVIVYQEAQTFAHKHAAQAWAKRRETELAVTGAIERASRKGHTVKEMIERYLIEAEKARPLGETKRLTLNAIKKSYLGEKIDSDISQQVLVDNALWRMGPEGRSVKPQTAGNDLAYLGSVLSLARVAWGYEINSLAMPDARLVLKKFGYNMRSRERDRRPTLDELDKVMEHFFEMLQRRPSVIHMPKVVAFAIFSKRRMDEITRILWDDLEEHRKAVKVRDMKNPGRSWVMMSGVIYQMRRGRLCRACRGSTRRYSRTTLTRSVLLGLKRAR